MPGLCHRLSNGLEALRLRCFPALRGRDLLPREEAQHSAHVHRVPSQGNPLVDHLAPEGQIVFTPADEILDLWLSGLLGITLRLFPKDTNCRMGFGGTSGRRPWRLLTCLTCDM